MKTEQMIITGIFFIAMLSLISPAFACMEETAEAGSHSAMTGAAVVGTASISGFLEIIQAVLIIAVLLLLAVFLVKKINKIREK